MRVAIVADPYVSVPPAKYGGTERVIYNLIRGLIEEGHEPVLLAAGDSAVSCELIPVVPKAIGFPPTKAEVPRWQRKLAAIAGSTEAKLRQLAGHSDVIHSHLQIGSGVNLAQFKHVPHLTTLHNPVTFEDINYYLRHQTEPYVSISKNQQAAFPGLNYVGVAYNGDDPALFPLIDKPQHYVSFLGRFDRQKNAHLAIRLAISLGVPIKLAGKFDQLSEGYFQEEIEPFLSHPLVEYLGEIGFDEKVELLSHAMCNLHPTGFREPFGLDVIEAAYCGTPTLAISRGAMPELIEEGRTGVLVEDFIEGFHRMSECLKMDRLYIAKRARTLFNYRTMTRDYLEAYEQVIANRGTVAGHRPQPAGWQQLPLYG